MKLFIPLSYLIVTTYHFIIRISITYALNTVCTLKKERERNMRGGRKSLLNFSEQRIFRYIVIIFLPSKVASYHRKIIGEYGLCLFTKLTLIFLNKCLFLNKCIYYVIFWGSSSS